MYPMADQELRKTIVQSLVQMGPKAVEALLGELQNPHPLIWDACVAALSDLLPESQIRVTLVESCVQRMQDSNKEKTLSSAIGRLGQEGLSDLAGQRYKEIRITLCDAAWSVLSKLADERVVATVRETVQDENEEIRENGLEVLAEGLGDRKLAYALLDMLKDSSEAGSETLEDPMAVLKQACHWSDNWLRTIAEHAIQREVQGEMANDQKLLTMLDKVIFLKQVSLFSDVSVDELGLIAGITQEEVYPDQTYLLRQGETNASMHLIIEGNVELSSISSNGMESTLGVLGPKQAIGETTALDQAKSSVTAQVIFDEVRVLSLRGDNLERLVRLYPEIGIGLLHASSARVRLLEAMLAKMG
jgi:hypothetical protein